MNILKLLLEFPRQYCLAKAVEMYNTALYFESLTDMENRSALAFSLAKFFMDLAEALPHNRPLTE